MQTETTKIDEEGLRKALGVKLWNKVTVKKVDKAKLTAIIADGEVSPELASGFLTVQKNKPYIRYSEGQRKDDEDSDE